MTAKTKAAATRADKKPATPSKWQALAAPFRGDQVSWRVGSTSKDKTKGMALAYIDARDVMDRLDEVCGPDGWQCRYSELSGGKTVCEIGIRTTAGEWVWKADGAGDTDHEGIKGALSDSFKRAAVRWGIGRYLYALPSPWMPIVAAGKSYAFDDSTRRKLAGLAQLSLDKWAAELQRMDTGEGAASAGAPAEDGGDADESRVSRARDSRPAPKSAAEKAAAKLAEFAQRAEATLNDAPDLSAVNEKWTAISGHPLFEALEVDHPQQAESLIALIDKRRAYFAAMSAPQERPADPPPPPPPPETEARKGYAEREKDRRAGLPEIKKFPEPKLWTPESARELGRQISAAIRAAVDYDHAGAIIAANHAALEKMGSLAQPPIDGVEWARGVAWKSHPHSRQSRDDGMGPSR